MQPVRPFDNSNETKTLSDALTKLVGSQLSSVEFVQDYVQLHFDGPTLTAYTLPTVVIGNSMFTLGDPGYRDALCNPIGSDVRRTQVERERLLVEFVNGASVAVSLRDSDYRGSEAIQFSLDGERFWVV